DPPNQLRDIAASRLSNSLLSIFVRKPDEIGAVYVSQNHPYNGEIGSIGQIHALKWDEDTHTDLMMLFPETGQIHIISGSGQGGFLLTLSGYIGARALCVEGGPVDAVLAPLDGDANLDLAVINKASGTLWTLHSEGIGKGYKVAQIIDVLPKPLQLELADMNGDDILDAVVLSSSGRFAVANGALPPAPPDFPATSPDVGDKGTFVGAVSVTTPIPEQASTAHCDLAKPGQPVNVAARLGTPLDRLIPRFVEVADFNEDGKTDMIIVPAYSPLEDLTDPGGQQRQAILFYESDGIMPTTFTSQSTTVPVTSFCSDGLDPVTGVCTAVDAGLKGAVTSVAWGAVNALGGPELIMATATSIVWNDEFQDPLNPGPFPRPEIPTVEILENQENGTFVQFDRPTKNVNLGVDDTTIWSDYGLFAFSKPSHVVTLQCGLDNSKDFAVIGARESNVEETVQFLTVVQGGTNDNYPSTSVPLPGVFTVTDMITARVTEAPGEGTSILLATPAGVRVLKPGLTVCTFLGAAEAISSTGTPERIAARDVNGDTFMDIVSPLPSGVVRIVLGVEGKHFEPDPINNLVIEDLGKPGPAHIRDVNGDGSRDILILDTAKARIYTFLGDGTGWFHPEPFVIQAADGTTEFEMSDLDQDGCLDLITLSPQAKAVSIMRNRTGDCIPDVLESL
ncbi:MAG: hypothetical protein ACI9WU_004431, partial [Myxococcota bacterium]